MPLFQYIGDGHTLIQTKRYARDKVKVSYGEIVEIEEGVHSASRIIMAGFQLVEDGAEAAIDAVVDGAKDVAEVLTETDIDGDGKIADGDESEAPAVEVTTEVVDDGSKDITLEVTTDEPKVDGSENTDIGAESNEAAPKADEAPAPTTEEAPKKAAPPAKKK